MSEPLKCFNLACSDFRSVPFFFLSSTSFHLCFFFFSYNFFHFAIMTFSFPFFFLLSSCVLFLSCFHFHYPFSTTMTSSHFPLINSPHKSLLQGDESVEISDEKECNGTNLPVMSEMLGQVVRIQQLAMAECTHEELFMKLSQIPDPQYTRSDISEKHCSDLVISMHQQGLHYSPGMMRLFLRAAKNPFSAAWTSISEKEDGRKVVKSAWFLANRDGSHHRRAIEMIREESSFSWTQKR